MRCQEITIEPHLLGRFQAWFSDDLTRVQWFAFADSARRMPLAFAESEKVFLSEQIADDSTGAGVAVVAHELAHILQKRRGIASQTPTAPAQLEAEAHAASLAFLAGEPCPPLSPDPLPTPRAWGPAGHFFSVYMVARHADLSDDDAEHLAFYAQMPDQVSDFDAYTKGTQWARTSVIPDTFGIRDGLLGFNDRLHGGRHKASDGDDFDGRINQIQAGLHCLGGRDAEGESRRRLNTLRNLPNDQYLTYAFGLGLHALGDSFAHRDGTGLTFMGPIGHAFAGRDLYEKLWTHGTAVDNLSRHPDTYSQYCCEMLHVIAERFNPRLKLKSDDRFKIIELGRKVQQVTSQGSEDAQIAKMLSFTRDRRSDYRPDQESCDMWEIFRANHIKMTSPWMREIGQKLAKQWVADYSTGPGFKCPLALDRNMAQAGE